MTEDGLYLGMISGTSRDGVDAALVRFHEDRPELLASACTPYPDDLAETLARALAPGRRPPDRDLAALDRALARPFADAALALLRGAGVDPGRVRAIGSHGQTVWHAPDGPRPESIQLGSPARIAEWTCVTTVGDFRRADIEAGGQGAPLAPLLHRALFATASAPRVVVNLGGIANVSILQPDGGVTGFDTGPANCLLDAWIRAQRGLAFDEGGQWSAGGRLLAPLLDAMRADPYFSLSPPKSTGTEYFNLDWLGRHTSGRAFAAADVQRTLAELTAATVSAAIRAAAPADVLVCGGGVHNGFLLQRIGALLDGLPLRSTAEAGLDPDWVEAVLFAWLARERLAGRVQDTRRITGARHPVLLGEVFAPSGL